ncbi:CHASE3 domain-containing protein [Leptolyngbya sp. FACHB-16]|uniref:sensor histidine kinase n=1 Tax=unclassified Leptolyngbya TaxID=2650499 RepID=UPI0016863B15|nr:CHASE3 domain-containing protein [Leptolyngbya sp. FACHB-16]MBD2152973.1 CHASE3 domain-containing protein [Leptolyngbya sp. FACHB-16]
MLLHSSHTSFRRRLTRTIALPIVLLLLFSGISIWQITQLLSALGWVNHTSEVISQANQTQKLLLDMETGFRGYLLTGQQEFLEPYKQANTAIDPTFNQLRKLVSDNPSQAQRVDEISLLFEQWEQQVVAALSRKQQGELEPFDNFERRKQMMDQMRQQIATFIATEEQLRTQRNQVAQQTTRSIIFTSLLLALVVGAVLAYFLHRQILRVSKTYENALHVAQVRTDEAEQSAVALQRSAQRLAALHDIDRAILAAETDETLIRNALHQLHQTVSYQQAFVAIFDVKANTAQVVAGSSPTGDLNPSVSTSLTVTDFTSEQSFPYGIRYIENLRTVEVLPPVLMQLRLHGFCSCLCVPLLVENTLIGELNLASTKLAAFDKETQEIVREVAAQLAIALQQSWLREQLKAYTSQLEQRVAERTAQLEETNQELEAFTYSVSHDLRAPLRTIQGFAAALLEDCGEQLEGFARSYVDSIIDDAIQMNRLISDLLSYSRLTRTQISLQPASLNEVVEEALKQVTVQIEERQAQIRIASSLPQVMAHRSTLIQVVTNLISNAIKFVDPIIQPQVDIFATSEREDNQDWIRLWIIDNGIGIAPEHQERIFCVFERLHGVESYPGTGIGLAIVRKGLERMSGRVGVESHEGQGSRFWVTLPSAVLARDNYDSTSSSSTY